MQILLKILLTLAYIYFSYVILSIIWIGQIDIRSTLKNLVKNPFNVIVKIDQDAIYQRGRLIGKVAEEFEKVNDEYYIDRIYGISEINLDKPFKYRGDMYKFTERHSIHNFDVANFPVLKSYYARGELRGFRCKKLD